MINKKFIAPVICLFILFFSCKNSGNNTSSNTHEFGAILPLTGELASYSEPMKQGMEMAKDKISKEDKDGIELKFSDSKAEAKTAVSSLIQMASVNNIKYVIGDISSTTTLAMVPVAESNHVFLLSPGASSPKLTGISKLFARNYPSSLDESIKSAQYAANQLQVKKAAVVYVNSEYGIGLKDAFEKKFKELGGAITDTEAYPFENVDFKTLIIKLKSSNPELVYLAGNQKEMGNFIKQLREANVTSKVISDISFLEADCLNIAKSAAEGVMVPVASYDPNDSTLSEAFEFGKLYKQKYNTEPSVAVAVGYDAVMLLYKAIKKEGDDPSKVAEYIRNLKNYNGALGVYSFENGDINMKTVFKVIKNGKPVEIK